MAAYIIGNITVTDPEGYGRYRDQVAPVIAQYGGRYLVRGGVVRPAEGDLGLDRLVIIEFDSMEALRRFYESTDYAPLRELRSASSRSNIAFVEGHVAG